MLECSVCLILHGRRDALRQPVSGYLGQSPLRCDPPIVGSDFLGFPWILSPGSRRINGSHEFSVEDFSSRYCRREITVEKAAHDS